MTEIATDVVLGERYRLVRRIAAGGMGAVWKAEDTVLHRPVAIKVLSEPLAADKRFAERFRREAQSAAGLSHPNVASVFDFGENDGRPFMVMELVEGETLSDRLAREAPLDPQTASRIAAAIASALQAAHDRGIVHRDVKPGNVMITPSGEIKVLDFGIAAAAGAPLTATGARMGTASYISPEQARGEPPTPASDVYSLGVVLFEMLTGRPPFTAESPVAVAAQHVDRPPPPLRPLVPNAPEDLVTACERALAKDPRARPASAAAFAALLSGRTAPMLQAGQGTEPGSTMVLPPLEPTSVLPEPAGAATPAAPAPPRARRRSLVPLAVAVVLLLLLAMSLALAFTLKGGGRPGPGNSPTASSKVQVPDVIGMKQGDAEHVLRDKGFQIGDVVKVEGEHDVVVRTSPPANSLVARGSTVTLYVGDKGKGKGKGHGGGDG